MATKSYSASVAGTVLDVETATNCRFSHIDIANTTAASAVCFLQIFNLPAASVTLGTTAPLLSYKVKGDDTRSISPATPVNLGGSGFSIAVTTTRAGSSAAGADVNILF